MKKLTWKYVLQCVEEAREVCCKDDLEEIISLGSVKTLKKHPRYSYWRYYYQVFVVRKHDPEVLKMVLESGEPWQIIWYSLNIRLVDDPEVLAKLNELRATLYKK